MVLILGYYKLVYLHLLEGIRAFLPAEHVPQDTGGHNAMANTGSSATSWRPPQSPATLWRYTEGLQLQRGPPVLHVYNPQMNQSRNWCLLPLPWQPLGSTAPHPPQTPWQGGDLLSESQESAGADSALFRPPNREAGLQLGGGLCLAEAGGALASLEDASPCSRHPFTSSTGMSAAELRMEGGQLLACPFWDGEVLALVEQAGLGWWGLSPKASPE